MKYNFLVMDDSPIIRTVVSRCLAMSGLDIGEVIQAQNGEEGLAAIKSKKIHMVFADLNMPVMSGRDVIEHLFSTGLIRLVPVIVISSERNEQVKKRLLEQGIKEFINKPFTPEHMKDVVERYLG